MKIVIIFAGLWLMSLGCNIRADDPDTDNSIPPTRWSAESSVKLDPEVIDLTDEPTAFGDLVAPDDDYATEIPEDSKERTTDNSEAALQKTYWQLSEINGRSLTDTRAYLVLNDNWSVNGSGGVNRFHGTYNLHGDNLSFSPLASTKMLGVSETVNALERNFFTTLTQAATYRIDKSVLLLFNVDGKEIAKFTAR